MTSNPFIEIDAPHLSVLERETEELLNEGTYGKALALYLETHLRELGYKATSVICEDWGWFLAAEREQFQLGICVYGYPKEHGEFVANSGPRNDATDTVDSPNAPVGTPLSLCVHVATQPRRYWDWRRFRRIDRSDLVDALNRDLLKIFEADSKITVVQCCDEFPLA